jgi:hypothetical protein
MAVADAHDLSEARSISGLQHGFLQLRRRVEGISTQGVISKRIIAMKFSTEAIVALAVATVFAVLSFGAIAREQGERPKLNTHNRYIAASQIAANNTDVLGVY